jgi:hypothetical protein
VILSLICFARKYISYRVNDNIYLSSTVITYFFQKIKEIGEIKTVCQIGGESADVFLTKCSKLCLFMCVKDPPVVLDFNFKKGDPLNKDKLSAFTKAGDSVDYLVWQVMYLNENGPVMGKGVAQGRKK